MRFIILIFLIVVFCCGKIEARDINRAEQIINSILSEDTSPDTEKDKSPYSGPQPEKNRIETDGEEPPAGFARTPEEIRLLKDATDLYNSGLLEEALLTAGKIIDEHPRSGITDSAGIMAGKIHIERMEYDEALAKLNRIPERSGEYSAALFYSARATALKGDKIASISLYRKAASVNPGGEKAPGAILQAAKLQMETGQGEAAVETTVRLIRNYTDRETVDDAYFLLAKIYETDKQVRDLETARSLYRLFIRKVEAGEPYFKDSPLKGRAEDNLRHIEKHHFRLD